MCYTIALKSADEFNANFVLFYFSSYTPIPLIRGGEVPTMNQISYKDLFLLEALVKTRKRFEFPQNYTDARSYVYVLIFTII